MSRAIQPWHTIADGDVLYGVSTQEVAVNWDEGGRESSFTRTDNENTTADLQKGENVSLSSASFGTICSELAWDAVLRSFDP